MSPWDRVIVLASANPHKASELAQLVRDELGTTIELRPRPRSLGEVDEAGETLEENARLKAEAVRASTGRAALADDTGLEVDALHGAPGVYSARFAGPHASYSDNIDKLLEALAGVEARGARFRTVVVLAFPDGSELVAEGSVSGVIARRRVGAGGFGYDPVFIPEGSTRSYGEMTNAEKNAISHRARALRALGALLRQRGEL